MNATSRRSFFKQATVGALGVAAATKTAAAKKTTQATGSTAASETKNEKGE